MKKPALLKKVLLLSVLSAVATVGLTACGGTKLDPALPAVTGNYGEAPKVEKGKGNPPKKLVTGVLQEGQGDKCGKDAMLSVRYHGQLWNGEEFDSSFSRGKEPVVFSLNGVIKGWQEGLADARPGSRMELVIPPELGYGSQEQGKIPPNSTLVFVVDIVNCLSEKEKKSGLANLTKAKPADKAPEGVTVTGKLGEKPTITVKDNLDLGKENLDVVLAEGTGEKLTESDYPIYQVTAFNPDSKVTESTWGDPSGPLVADRPVGKNPDLNGKAIGSRVFVYLADVNGQGKRIFIIDLVGKFSAEKK